MLRTLTIAALVLVAPVAIATESDALLDQDGDGYYAFGCGHKCPHQYYEGIELFELDDDDHDPKIGSLFADYPERFPNLGEQCPGMEEDSGLEAGA